MAASLFVGVNYLYFAIKRIQKDVRGLVVLSGVVFGLVVGLWRCWRILEWGRGCGGRNVVGVGSVGAMVRGLS